MNYRIQPEIAEYIKSKMLRVDLNPNVNWIRSEKHLNSEFYNEINSSINKFNITHLPQKLQLLYLINEWDFSVCKICGSKATNTKKTKVKYCSKKCAYKGTKSRRKSSRSIKIKNLIKEAKPSNKSIEEILHILEKKSRYVRKDEYCLEHNIYADIKKIGNGSFEGGINILRKENDWSLYKKEVYKLTKTNKPLTSLKVGLLGVDGAYQLDHKFSIKEGFDKNILPYIIAHPKNLEYIPWKENITKGVKSSITEKELFTFLK